MVAMQKLPLLEYRINNCHKDAHIVFFIKHLSMTCNHYNLLGSIILFVLIHQKGSLKISSLDAIVSRAKGWSAYHLTKEFSVCLPVTWS